MNSPGCVWPKLYVAVDCLCGDGPFRKRLENATMSALIRLEDAGLTGDLGEELKFVLGWTRDNIADGVLQREPDELERKTLIDKMLYVMLETHEKQTVDRAGGASSPPLPPPWLVP